MTSTAGAIWAVLAVPLAGLPYALALRLRGTLLAATCWLLGGGLVAAAMLIESIVHVPFSRAALAAAWLVIVLIGAGLLALDRGVLPWTNGSRAARKDRGGILSGVAVFAPNPRGRISPLTALLVAICALQVAYVFLVAIRVPLGSFDAWSLWEFKGRRFWMDGAVSGAFLHDQAIIFAHPAYPPLLPLLIAWVYTWAGAADPALMKPLFPLFYLALLLAFHGGLRQRVPWLALPATAALALLPRLADYAGTGLADMPLAAYLVGAAATAVPGLRARDWRSMAAASALLGLAMATKRDGTMFFLAALLTLLLIERSWRRLLAWAWPAALIGLPWYLYARLSGVPDRDFLPLSLGNLADHAGRVAPITRLFALNTLAIDEWSVLWIAFLVVLLLSVRRGGIRAPALLALIVLPLAGYIVSLSLSAWPDYMLHVRTSLDRLIMVTTPFALWFICEQFRPPRPASGCDRMAGPGARSTGGSDWPHTPTAVG